MDEFRRIVEGLVSSNKAAIISTLNKMVEQIGEGVARAGFRRIRQMPINSVARIAKVQVKVSKWTIMIVIYDEDDVKIQLQSDLANVLQSPNYYNLHGADEAITRMSTIYKQLLAYAKQKGLGGDNESNNNSQ